MARKAGWLVAILGAWEFVSAFALHGALPAIWSPFFVGIAVLLLAVWSVNTDNISTAVKLAWINALLGLWILVSPFAAGFASAKAAMLNDVIVGALVLVLSVVEALGLRKEAVA